MSRKLVSLSEDTLEELSKMAKPFESPNKCIKRILDSLQNKLEGFSKDSKDYDKNEHGAGF